METYTTYINASAKPVEEVDNFEVGSCFEPPDYR